ncbi:phage portal protein [Streptomyces sp. 5-8]|uniref:Phage portal protein n=1 Tax=Streptomyces musisoli TaxID=2802280 RepID=A0ABS1NY42_9ACTN|nr:phage portal protein [Streptomyces musisoli]MBL1104934.1 phage portal protein [Streptomyces musisoli]
MPLPQNDIAWPPTDPCVQAALADWDAWYSADPDRLGERYLGRTSREAPDFRPSQFRGGMVGRVARWFWGIPSGPGQKRTKLHVPIAGDIARTSSSLLFSEPPVLLSTEKGTQARLDDLVESGLHPTLLEAGEVCAALGGAYLRVVWDQEISNRPWIDSVAADAAVPEFRYGRLIAVTFWTVVEQDNREVWRHLERHEKGRILHGLYRGTVGTLGTRLPLADHPDTEPFANLVTEDWIETGAPAHLTAAYVPNVRPAKAWRHIPSAAHWGQSDFQGVEPIFDALDETWTSWMRDIRIGKGRIVVPNSMLRDHGPGQGASWNEDQEVYAGLEMLERPGENQLTVTQFAIRVQEHKETCSALIEQAARQAGYSAATFGITGDGSAVTATEIRARERRSMSTRARKTLYWRPALADIVAALLAVEAGPLFGVSALDLEPPHVEFEDSISESPKEVAETVELLRRAQAASAETLVRMQHPDWDDPQVSREVDAILNESKRTLIDSTTEAEAPVRAT